MNSTESALVAAPAARHGTGRRSRRLLAVIDAHQVTGPAKQVIESLRRLGPGTAPVIGVLQRKSGETAFRRSSAKRPPCLASERAGSTRRLGCLVLST